MYIKLYKGFLSPTTLHHKKPKIDDRIEYKLAKLGFKIDGSNFAKYECITIDELTKMMIQLGKLNIAGAEVCWI